MHEAAEASGNDTSDGESSGADHVPLADSERALGGDGTRSQGLATKSYILSLFSLLRNHTLWSSALSS